MGTRRTNRVAAAIMIRSTHRFAGRSAWGDVKSKKGCHDFNILTATTKRCNVEVSTRVPEIVQKYPIALWYNKNMSSSKNTKPPHITNAEFQAKFLALDYPALDATQDTYRTADVLTHLGSFYHWPSRNDPDAKQQFDAKILEAIERVDWSLYTENFVYIPSNFYPYLVDCMQRNDPFVENIQNTRFAKLCALTYALVVDVHPYRRSNLRPRIEAWAGVEVDAKAPTMLGAVLSAWSRDDAALILGNYGAMLATLDPQSSRSAMVVNNLLQQMEGGAVNAAESIHFDFDSSQ